MKFSVFFLVLFLSVTTAWGAPQKVHVGHFQSRAIWTPYEAVNPQEKLPVVIMVPGSAAQGPEEMMPGRFTSDGKDHSIFADFALPFFKAHVHTLALGKPGVEFFPGWKGKWFYDQWLYDELVWQDLIDNVAEAVAWVRRMPHVDGRRIYILGHSEGTQVAVDYAAIDPTIAGVILLGYAGEDMATTLDWQLFKRPLEKWINTDVDINHDGFISKREASTWKEFNWPWAEGQDKIAVKDVEKAIRDNKDTLDVYAKFEKLPLYSNGIFKRGPMYKKTAGLVQTVYAFTGENDMQTPKEQALALAKTCREMKKPNCFVTVVPGLTHGFSTLKRPRQQVLLDHTVGPVDRRFQNILFKLGQSF